MIEEYIKTIATQGLLGILLIIVGIAYYRKDCQLSEIQEKRLNDLKEIKDQYSILVKDITETLDTLISLIRGKK